MAGVGAAAHSHGDHVCCLYRVQCALTHSRIGIAAAFILAFGGSGEATDVYGNYVLGVIAAIHPVLTWTPQIWTTYKRKVSSRRSLSDTHTAATVARQSQSNYVAGTPSRRDSGCILPGE